MAREEFDLVIVGGGINGAGAARDGASRGLKVALIEADDFASGTSSRSSKLIHGGVRYLENLEFGLVFEALSERARLFEIAPHLSEPLRFIIPIFKDSRVGFFKMGLGMLLYDLLATFDSPELHAKLTPSETLTRAHGLQTRGLLGAYEYSDGFMDDDRLVYESLRSAAQWGAKAANYCSAVGVHKEGDVLRSIQVKDHRSGEEFSIRGRQFVGALGPWTDVFGSAHFKGWQKQMRPTKGIHLTFSKNRIPINKAVVMAVEKRILFVIPRPNYVLVGTTDTDFLEDPRDVKVQAADVDYVMAALKNYFPRLDLKKEDIIGAYAGVRPLVADGSSSEGKTSREHQFFHWGKNWTQVAGGKYTTYRKMCQELIDIVLKKMPFEQRMLFGKSQTLRPLIASATHEKIERLQLGVDHWSKTFGVPKKYFEKLIGRHGEEALELAQSWSSMDVVVPAMGPVSSGSGSSSGSSAGTRSPTDEHRYWALEALHSLRASMCLCLRDFYFRRSSLFLSRADHGLEYLPTLQKVFQKELGLSDSELKEQTDQLHQALSEALSWKS